MNMRKKYSQKIQISSIKKQIPSILQKLVLANLNNITIFQTKSQESQNLKKSLRTLKERIFLTNPVNFIRCKKCKIKIQKI